MAYRFVPFPITLNDFEGHSLIARLFKCKSTSIYATFRTDSTDTARHADPRRQLSFRLLLALLAVYAEQGLCNCRPSICPSVCLSHPAAARSCGGFAAVGQATGDIDRLLHGRRDGCQQQPCAAAGCGQCHVVS